MSGKYKEQWQNYFEGGIEMWSYFGYQYHSYTITKHIVSKLSIPKHGKLIQLGTGLGVVVEYLCNKYGYDRVIGYDLFNPLGHPNIEFLDMETDIPDENKIAYLEIDVGSMSHFSEQRKKILEWSFSNMVSGGYVLTNKKLALELQEEPASSWNFELGQHRFDIINLNEFDVPELWENVHQSRLNTKVLLKIGDRNK